MAANQANVQAGQSCPSFPGRQHSLRQGTSLQDCLVDSLGLGQGAHTQLPIQDGDQVLVLLQGRASVARCTVEFDESAVHILGQLVGGQIVSRAGDGRTKLLSARVESDECGQCLQVPSLPCRALHCRPDLKLGALGQGKAVQERAAIEGHGLLEAAGLGRELLEGCRVGPDTIRVQPDPVILCEQ